MLIAPAGGSFCLSLTAAHVLQRLPVDAVDHPVAHRLRAEGAVKVDARPVPVQTPPLQTAAAARPASRNVTVSVAGSERERLQRLVVLRVAGGERLPLDRDAHGRAVEVIEEGVDKAAHVQELARRAARAQAGKEGLIHVETERVAVFRDGEHLTVLRQGVMRNELRDDRLRIRHRDGRLRVRDLRRAGTQVVSRVVRKIELAGRVHAAGDGRLRRRCLRRGSLLRRVLFAAGAQQRQRQHAREQERKIFFHMRSSYAAAQDAPTAVFSSIPHRRAARNLDIAGCIC